MCAREARPEMGIATELTVENKNLYRRFLCRFEAATPGAVERAGPAHFDAGAKVAVSHPVNEARGGVGYFTDIIAPIMAAFDGCTRRNEILLGGEYPGTEWVTSTGCFGGGFARPLFGIRPTGKRVFLREGDWWRRKDGKIIENGCMLDIAHVLVQLGYDLFADLEAAA